MCNNISVFFIEYFSQIIFCLFFCLKQHVSRFLVYIILFVFSQICLFDWFYKQIVNRIPFVIQFVRSSLKADQSFTQCTLVVKLCFSSLSRNKHATSGVQWRSARASDSKLRGPGFDPDRCHHVVILSKTH